MITWFDGIEFDKRSLFVFKWSLRSRDCTTCAIGFSAQTSILLDNNGIGWHLMQIDGNFWNRVVVYYCAWCTHLNWFQSESETSSVPKKIPTKAIMMSNDNGSDETLLHRLSYYNGFCCVRKEAYAMNAPSWSIVWIRWKNVIEYIRLDKIEPRIMIR